MHKILYRYLLMYDKYELMIYTVHAKPLLLLDCFRFVVAVLNIWRPRWRPRQKKKGLLLATGIFRGFWTQWTVSKLVKQRMCMFV